jgi:excisionase family DNA binding protein
MTAEQIPSWDRLTCSISEACVVMSHGRSNILGMIARGEIETKKIGRRRLVTIRSLQALSDQPDAEGDRTASSTQKD